MLTAAQLAARTRPLTERVTAAAAALQAADQDARRYTRDGGGPAEKALQQTRARLAEQVRQIDAAEAAGRELQHARQTVSDGRERIHQLRQREVDLQRELDSLGSLRPSHRARRRQLQADLPRVRAELVAVRERLEPVRLQGPALQEAAERAAAQAPPGNVWPMVRRRHADLERDLDNALRGARAVDVDDASQRAGRARHNHDLAHAQLAAVQQEQQRRADLPPDRRDVERAARAEHAQRQRQARQDDPTRPAPGRQREQERQRRNEAYRPPPGHGVDRGPGLSR
ncbi:hypothetical protein ACGF0J_22180 [Nonomuraea sp. NPDC047897]|uniref:hypothetical protein n=1 Tax=Nonomuraea sp. NPDC047897 TaxID=3364346 RepID=UPI00371C5370